ncbi:MAG: glycosyl hydrolase [Solirubrobacteraceae bacterium]
MTGVTMPEFHRRFTALLLAALFFFCVWAGVGAGAGVAKTSSLRACAQRKDTLSSQLQAHARKRAAAHPSKAGVATTGFGWYNPTLLEKISASWAYNGYPDTGPNGRHLQWVPEIQDLSMLTPSAVKSLTLAHRDGQAKYLLTFNEPDDVHQSYMKPAAAAAVWPELERTGLKLGSPATDWLGDGWLAQFMQIAHRKHLRVNFITLHFYQDFTSPNAVTSLRERLIKIYNTYHMPLWITEIGTDDIRDWGESMAHTPTQALAVRYLQQLFTMLNKLSFVQRYSWYTDVCPNNPACELSSLFTPSGGITALGKAFKRARALR